MKTRNKKIQGTFLSTVAQAALVAMFFITMTAVSVATAEEEMEEEGMLEEEAEALPPLYTNEIEFGAIYISDDSFKFGEYSGLDDSGVDALGNLSVLGSDGTLRWDLLGTDLGLTSRSVNASLSNPGLWDLNVGYDGLRHYISDTYQTPQIGSLGGNNFTLPVNFGTIDGSHSGTDAPFDAGSTRGLSATQQSLFHTEEIYSDRDKVSFGAGYHFNKQWSMKFDFNHLEQSGAKLIGTGEYGASIAFLGGDTARAEGVNIIMNPTEYTTDTINLALNWQGDKAHLSVGYYGSLFDDKYNSLSWQNNLSNNATCVGAGACFTTNTMSTAPDNEFHQFNLTGAYVHSARTKLVGGFSYGVATQDDDYAPTLIQQGTGVFDTMQPGGLPQSSLDGEVITTHADLKLTHRPSRKLMLSGAFKYNERENNTASKTYLYKRLGNGNPYTGVNLPYSNRKIQFQVAADYRLSKTQKLHLGYEHEFIDRWCDDVVGGFECVASPESDEDKLELSYRAKASDTVRLNVGYTLAHRNAEFDRTHVSNISTPPSGYPGINSGDDLRFNAYIYDDRTQHMVKGAINWQASNKLDLGLNGRYSNYDYGGGLGRQDSDAASINLDTTYIYNEDGSVSAYASWQNSEREMQLWEDGKPLTSIWTNQLKQDSYAIGLNARHDGLMDGKLDVLGDVSYSFDTSHYSTQIPYEAATCVLPASFECGDTPDIETSRFTVQLSGTYEVNKNGKLRLGYMYELLDTEDYYYNGLQLGFTPDRVLPTNEQPWGYSNHTIGLTYIFEF